MSLKNLTIAFALAVPGAAHADLPFGLTDEVIAQGALHAAPGAPLSAVRIIPSGDGGAELFDVSISGEESRVLVGKMTILPDGSVTLESGRILANGDGKGEIAFNLARYGEAALLERMIDGVEICSPIGEPLPGGGKMIPAQMSGVTMTAPGNAMAGAGMLTSAEKMGITDLDLQVYVAADASCISPSAVTASDLSMLAADGSTAKIQHVEMRYEIGEIEPPRYGGALTVRGLEMFGADGKDMGSLGEISAEIGMTPEAFTALNAIATDTGTRRGIIGRIAGVLAIDGTVISMKVDAARVPMSDFLGDRVAEKFSLEDGEVTTSSSLFSLRTDEGKLKLEIRGDVSGLGKTDLSTTVVATPENQAGSMLNVLTARAPAAELLGHIQLADLAFSVEDLGAMARLEKVTGTPAADYAEHLIRRLGPAPTEIREGIAAWIRKTVETGKGQVKVSPLEPVGLVEIGMAAMVNPAGLGKMLSVTAE